jgi:hypothetical protein
LKAVDYPSEEQTDLGGNFRSIDRALAELLKKGKELRPWLGPGAHVVVSILSVGELVAGNEESATVAELTLYGGHEGTL